MAFTVVIASDICRQCGEPVYAGGSKAEVSHLVCAIEARYESEAARVDTRGRHQRETALISRAHRRAA